MKKVVAITINLLALLCLCLGISQAQQTEDKACAARIKTFSQAVELWANDHDGKFPDISEFGSDEFFKYVKKVEPTATPKIRYCKDSDLTYEYALSGKNYLIKCPNPWIHKTGAYFYSRDTGTVQTKGEPLSDKEIKDLKSQKLKQKENAKTADKTKERKKENAKKTDKTKERKKENVQKTEKDVKDDTKTPKATNTSAVLTEEDKNAMVSVIKELYDAYATRNLEKVLELQKESIESSAVEYERQGKGSAQDVRDAYRSATDEILNHKEFRMLPLNISDLTFQKKGELCRVTSVVPIIATDRLEVSEDGKYFFVRLRIGEFVFAPNEKGWKIHTMYLY